MNFADSKPFFEKVRKWEAKRSPFWQIIYGKTQARKRNFPPARNKKLSDFRKSVFIL